MTQKKGLSDSVALPNGVQASFQNGALMVKGKKGEVQRELRNPILKVSIADGKITVGSDKGSKNEKKIVNSTLAHIRNMVHGVQEGHQYLLKVCVSHFPMSVSVSGSTFTVKNFLGEKQPRTLALKKGATVKVEGDKITVESADKEIAGTVASDIEKLTRRPKFAPRVFQDGIYLTSKAGKPI